MTQDFFQFGFRDAKSVAEIAGVCAALWGAWGTLWGDHSVVLLLYMDEA